MLLTRFLRTVAYKRRTFLAANSRTDRKGFLMGKATRLKEVIDTPTPEQLAAGSFELVGVTHVDEVQTTSRAYRRCKSQSSLERMRDRGAITDDALTAARQIAMVAEYLERTTAARCASMEARVDCSGSPEAQVNESLLMVRLEAAYSEWRASLPLPRRMIIDMVTQDSALADIARSYGRSWVSARAVLVKELERWPEVAKRYAKSIRHEDLVIAHARLSV